VYSQQKRKEGKYSSFPRACWRFLAGAFLLALSAVFPIFDLLCARVIGVFFHSSSAFEDVLIRPRFTFCNLPLKGK
jgi:hypothetical protein